MEPDLAALNDDQLMRKFMASDDESDIARELAHRLRQRMWAELDTITLTPTRREKH